MTAQFDDGKEGGALRTIGEVSRATGIKTHVLRYWEQQLPMLEPLKRSGGRRYYRTEDVALIETIDRLVNQQGYTLKGAQQVIEGADTEQAQSGTAEPAAPEQHESESTAPQSPAIAPAFDPAADGGLDDFFGKSAASEADDETGIAFDDAEAAPAPASHADDSTLTRAEIRTRLMSLRDELAQAIAA